jgi:moderate conductance mechanosensitive channel
MEFLKLQPWAVAGVRALVVLAVGYILTLLVIRLMNALENSAVTMLKHVGEPADVESEKRARTLVFVIRRPLLFLIWVTVLLMAIQELGIQMAPLLAGAGVGAGIIGVAVGFGAQTVVKDMIAGFFLLFENQVRLNDVVVINGIGGSVEKINLRTTVLRAENGAVHIFPNGSIQTLANLTREFAYSVFEVSVAIAEDTDRVIAILTEIGAELRADALCGPLILAPIEVYGIDRFTDSNAVVKGRIKTAAHKQWTVTRDFNRLLKLKMNEAGIALATGSRIVRIETRS